MAKNSFTTSYKMHQSIDVKFGLYLIKQNPIVFCEHKKYKKQHDKP